MEIRDEIEKLVIGGVSSVLELAEFKSWSAEEDEINEGHVAINNSVLFREDLKTTKNARFLCVPIEAKNKFKTGQICLVSNIKFNNKFAYVSPKDKKASFEKFDSVLSCWKYSRGAGRGLRARP